MKKRKSSLLKISTLVVLLLVIMAFVRGHMQQWLMIVSVVAWLMLSVGIKGLQFSFRIMKIAKRKFKSNFQRLAKRLLEEDTKVADKKEIYNIELTEDPDALTMCYVNQLITLKLQSAYPSATWDWIADNPILAVKQCKTARISTRDTGQYNQGEVTFDSIGCIRVALIKYASLENDLVKRTANSGNSFDVDSWYGLKGQQILSSIIKELHTKGFHTVSIGKDGSIFTMDKDQQVKNERFQFSDFPDKRYWKKLVALITDQHKQAVIDKEYIHIQW